MATISKRAKWITANVAVWSAYARELGDNGKAGDERIALMVAPSVSTDDEYLYLETNGDPVLVGWIEDDEHRLAESFDVAWLEAERWLEDLLPQVDAYLPE